MSQTRDEPARLAELPSEQDLLGVSPLVRAAAAPLSEIAPAARQRIRGRLYVSLAGRKQIFHGRWRLALILTFTLAVGGVVGAATHSVIVKRLSAKKDAQPELPREPAVKRRISMQSASSAPPVPAAPAEEVPQPVHLLGPLPAESPPVAIPSVETAPAEAPPRSAAVASRSVLLRPFPAGPASPPVSAPLFDGLSPPAARANGVAPRAEATVLAEAIRKLRVDGDAAAALGLLEQHRNRFSQSALGHEASAVRIEALLKLGRTDAALADLDRLPLHAMPRRDEWHVVRGELRAQAGRWSSAEADFAVVLSGRLRDAGGELAERALWGRAVAHSHQGNVAGTRADASEYLRRFPAGRFAGQARQTLLGASPP